MITTPTIKYYDHFLMKEVPSFRYKQSSGKKEAALLKKEISKIVSDLQKVIYFKFGKTADEKCSHYIEVLKIYTDRLNELNVKIVKLMVAPDSEMLYDDQYRKEYKTLFLNSITELHMLIAEIGPLKSEAKAFTENFNLHRSVFNVLQPIRRMVQMGFSFSQS